MSEILLDTSKDNVMKKSSSMRIVEHHSLDEGLSHKRALSRNKSLPLQESPNLVASQNRNESLSKKRVAEPKKKLSDISESEDDYSQKSEVTISEGEESQSDLESTIESSNKHSDIKHNTKKSIHLGDYQLGEVLGKGASSVVYKALNVVTGDFVAIKQLNKQKLKEDVLAGVKKELEILPRLQHPNIIRYLDFHETPEQLNLIFEYVENGSLIDTIKKFGTFPESLVAMYIDQVLSGLTYLHQEGIIHADIKASNMLITKEGVVKLCDFGVSGNAQEKKEVVCGTPYWMAPEVVDLSGLVPASDMWGVACTIFELLTAFPPYFDCNPMTAMFKIVEGNIPPFPEGITQELTNFLNACFQRDPKNRLRASEAKAHPWIKTSLAKKQHVASNFQELTGMLIEYNQHNVDRVRVLRGLDKDREDEIDFDDLLKEPVNQELLKLSDDAIRFKRKSSFRDKKQLPQLSSVQEKPLTRKRFNSLMTKGAISDLAPIKEGYLKSRQKYWFVLHQNTPLLNYYSKREDFIKGKAPKGQILLLGCELQRTDAIRDEHNAFIIRQADAQKFVLCAKTDAEMESWISAITSKQKYTGSEDLSIYQELIKKHETHIKELQKALKVLLNEQDTKKITRPNEGFYKEFFFFLALSVKRNENITVSINVDALYDRARDENIPFHKWYTWIPQQIREAINKHEADMKNKLENEQEQLEEEKMEKLRKKHINQKLCPGCGLPIEITSSSFIQGWGRKWHQDCFHCSLCNTSFSESNFYFFESSPEEKFCKKCYFKLSEMIQKNLITPELALKRSP